MKDFIVLVLPSVAWSVGFKADESVSERSIAVFGCITESTSAARVRPDCVLESPSSENMLTPFVILVAAQLLAQL
jgi:hypothetical protein